MNDDIAIKVDNVSKTFRLPHERQNSIKGSLISIVRGGKRSYEKQQVLKDISFEIKKGEFFGIVGRNGSGKSTLLKMLAGIYAPSKGQIHVNGKLTPFIELGVGFNPELTGRENVFLNGALLGFNRKEMAEMYDDIVEFAELEKFMDQKLKNYSSGMQVRLAFSIAIRAKGEILVLDEVLAVGDALFQKKCFEYFKQLKEEKRTVVFVSHDSNALMEYCTRGILIEKGRVVTLDKMERVVNEYIDILNSQEDAQESMRPQDKKRWGTQDASVVSATPSQKVYKDEDKFVRLEIKYQANIDIKDPVFGLIITDENGHRVFGSNTLLKNVKTSLIYGNEAVTVNWIIPNAFNSGTFTVAPAVANLDGTTIYDWLENGCKFRIQKKLKSPAFINIEHDIKLTRNSEEK